MADGTDETVPGFKCGDRVWPREGPMVLQRAPQTVIGTYKHPVAGDWLWLDDGNCGFRSYAAVHWTTEEPGEAEMAAREVRVQERIAENAARPAFPILPTPSSGLRFPKGISDA